MNSGLDARSLRMPGRWSEGMIPGSLAHTWPRGGSRREVRHGMCPLAKLGFAVCLSVAGTLLGASSAEAWCPAFQHVLIIFARIVVGEHVRSEYRQRLAVGSEANRLFSAGHGARPPEPVAKIRVCVAASRPKDIFGVIVEEDGLDSSWQWLALAEPVNALEVAKALGHEAVVDVTARTQHNCDRQGSRFCISYCRSGQGGAAHCRHALDRVQTVAKSEKLPAKLGFRHEKACREMISFQFEGVGRNETGPGFVMAVARREDVIHMAVEYVVPDLMGNAEPLKSFIVDMGGVHDPEHVLMPDQHSGDADGLSRLGLNENAEAAGNSNRINREGGDALVGKELLRFAHGHLVSHWVEHSRAASAGPLAVGEHLHEGLRELAIVGGQVLEVTIERVGIGIGLRIVDPA